MNQNELKIFIHHFHVAIRRLAMGLMCLILAPAALAPLTAYRPYAMQIITIISMKVWSTATTRDSTRRAP